MENKDVRHLVTIRTIDNILPIENADKIEIVVIGGWHVVTKKNEFNVGDKVFYFEIDSFLPDGIEPFQFLVDKQEKTAVNDEGKTVKGHRLRTIKLRGEYSQGLVLSLSAFDFTGNEPQNKIDEFFAELGVFKYEPLVPQAMHIKGTYPEFTRKTDSERVQNLSDDYLIYLAEKGPWKAYEKLDGMSSTWWKDENGELKVASRNYTLDFDNAPLHNALAEKYDLANVLEIGDIMKAEVYGEGIQGNPLKVKGQHLGLFDWESPRGIPDKLKELRVPEYDLPFPKTVAEAINQVDKLRSKVNPNVNAEGVVWWNVNKTEFNKLGERPNFKAINNAYLLKHE